MSVEAGAAEEFLLEKHRLPAFVSPFVGDGKPGHPAPDNGDVCFE